MNPKRNASYTPRWLERLLAHEGKGAFGSSKHGRGHMNSPTWASHRRTRRKIAARSRRINRGKQ